MDFNSLQGTISDPLAGSAAGSADLAPTIDVGSASIDNFTKLPSQLLDTLATYLFRAGI